MLELKAEKKALEHYLKVQHWLSPEETVQRFEKPGEGNMNFVVRIDTGKRTFILKQSRPYVEKYPQVAAPEERAQFEADFFDLAATIPALSGMIPELLENDAQNHVLLLEDLGAGSDYTYCYEKGKTIPERELMELMDFASTLHSTLTTKTSSTPLQNLKMRALNHEHIFKFPYMEGNGMDLDDVLSGLAAVAVSFKKDDHLQARVSALGALYLSDGPSLLHGDYYPGSWLKTKDGVKVIDPEFCFFGVPEFEIGVTIAHLKMAQQSQELIDKSLNRYLQKGDLDKKLCDQFTAVEVLRRILGLAQLPLSLDLEQRTVLLEEARKVLLN